MICPDTGPESAIIESILSDARSEADRIIAKAKRALESQQKKAEMEATKIKEDAISRATTEIERIRKREISIAKMEAKRILLGARERLISMALERIRERLSELRREPAYRESLLNLSSEAIGSIGANRVILRFSNIDSKLIGQSFIDELRRRVGGEAEVEVRTDLGDDKAGCIALSSDQRVVFDNTYDARIKRFEQALRAKIAEELVRQDG